MLQCLGKHGPYSFYKSIRLGDRVLTLASQFPVRIYPDSTILSIAEVQLLWTDKSESLCSLKLYFLPENTPDGRLEHHGEDEVLGLHDPVIIRAADLASWLVDEKDWDWGFLTPSTGSNKAPSSKLCKAFTNEKCVKEDKVKDGVYTTDYASNKVIVLTYERYMRLRTMLKRLEGTPDLADWLSNPIVLALGGLPIGPSCRIMFAKEAFDYPELEDHELLCNHMAPKLKGKQKKRKRKRHPSMGSDSNISESSSSGSSGSIKAKRSVNGVGRDRNEPFKLDVNDLARLYSQGILTNADFKDGVLKPTAAVMKKITDKMVADSLRLQNNGRLGVENLPRGYPNSNNRSMVMPSRRMKGERGARGGQELLGPDLSELAQKLEKSNALQILPIRPSVIQKQEPFQEDYQRKKSVKTESPLTFNGDITARLFHVKPEPGLRGRQCTGPFHTSTQVYSSPVIRSNVTRPEKAFSNELQTVKDNLKSGKGKSQVSATEFADKEKMPAPRFATPSIFVPTNKIFGDPSNDRKRSALTPANDQNEDRPVSRSDQRQTESVGKVRRLDVPSSSSSSAIKPKQEFQDLSEAEEAAKQMYHGLTDIPPPNAMNHQGLRLTSEVTLFPSNLLSGFVGAGLKDLKDVKPELPNPQLAGTSGRTSKAAKDARWEQKMVPESHSHSSARASAASAANVKPTFSGDLRHDLLNTSSPSGSKYPGHSSSRSAKKSEMALPASMKDSVGASSATSSSASKQSTSQSHLNRDKSRESLLQLNPGAHFGPPGVPPGMFPKMDPNYLQLFSHMFMPPSGMGGLGFPGMLGMPPGALEQIQLYQELIRKGLVPQFPGWMPDNAQDRSQK